GNQILGGYDTAGVTASILPSTPKLTGASAAKGSITVKWSKVSNANGYRVYRKTGSSGWTRIANISKNSTTSYRDTNVKAGTTYIYTVRACANTGNTVVLSGYNTKGVSAKAK
ncbi:MAG: fibronectin type III domain-containing protein, partial [Butyricicoccaceae bacterium]